jgi:hypothetical protein
MDLSGTSAAADLDLDTSSLPVPWNMVSSGIPEEQKAVDVSDMDTRLWESSPDPSRTTARREALSPELSPRTLIRNLTRDYPGEEEEE